MTVSFAFGGGGAVSNASTASGGIVNLDWFLTAGNLPANWDRSQYVLDQITQHTGVTLSMEVPAQDADTKLNLMIVNGDLPDIITLTNQTLINEMISADMVWSIDEFLKKYLPDSHILKQYPEDIKQALILRDGGWYSFPSHILSDNNKEIWGLNPATEQMWLDAKYRSGGGFIFNKTIMDQLGISLADVSTEAGLLAAFDKVKNANLTVGGQSVYTLLADGASFYGGSWKADGGGVGIFAASFGTLPVDSQGNYQSILYTDGYKHAVQFLNKCAQKGYVNANQFTLDRSAVEAACRSGRVFCFAGNTSDTGFAYAGEWTTPGPIFSSDGSVPTLGVSSATGTGWLQSFISKKTRYPEQAAKFLDYMSSREGLILWNYGQENVDWSYTPERLIKRTVEGTRKFDSGNITGVGAFWAFANQNFDRSILDPSTDPGVIPQSAYGSNEKTYKYNSAALTLPSGYVQPGDKYNNIEIEIKNYIGNALATLILDATDANFDARYSAFLSSLNSFGLKDYDAYINEAVQKNYSALRYRILPPK
jgi:putative aldouronate transport system substrate-binding protein